jgi:hypothetical protein
MGFAPNSAPMFVAVGVSKEVICFCRPALDLTGESTQGIATHVAPVVTFANQ